MSKKDKALRWPIGVGLSIILVFFAAIATVIVAIEYPVEESDLFMKNYHDADANINDLINEQIAFDKVYTIKYATEQFKADSAIIVYKITDKQGKAINNADLDVIITRPDIHAYDMTLAKPTVEDGVYTYKSVALAKPGRWDILAKFTIGDEMRYQKLKVDTRNSYVEEPQY